MQIIVIGAIKGGVGKTNFTFNMAGFLAVIHNKKVLTIDLDPQNSLTKAFRIKKINSSTLTFKHMFIDPKPLSSLIQKTSIKNVDLIPSYLPSCANLEIQLVSVLGRERILGKYIRQYIDVLEANYDYVIIDTSPAFNIININAFIIADSIIQISDNSVHSIAGLKYMFEQWKATTTGLNISNNIKAIILNNFDHYQVSKDFKEAMDHSIFKKYICPTEIRRKTVFKKSEVSGIPAILDKKFNKKDNPYFGVYQDLINKKVL